MNATFRVMGYGAIAVLIKAPSLLDYQYRKIKVNNLIAAGEPCCCWQTKAGLCGGSVYKQIDAKLFQSLQTLGLSGLCSGQLTGDKYKVVPQDTWMGLN